MTKQNLPDVPLPHLRLTGEAFMLTSSLLSENRVLPTVALGSYIFHVSRDEIREIHQLLLDRGWLIEDRPGVYRSSEPARDRLGLMFDNLALLQQVFGFGSSLSETLPWVNVAATLRVAPPGPEGAVPLHGTDSGTAEILFPHWEQSVDYLPEVYDQYLEAFCYRLGARRFRQAAEGFCVNALGVSSVDNASPAGRRAVLHHLRALT